MKEGLTHLGDKKIKEITNYDPKLLEKFENQNPKKDYWVSLDCFEFTLLCPITKQPDFGKIIINYIPDKYLVESKSLKLYLTSFRTYGDFSEDVINLILNDLISLLEPKYMELRASFNPRGGIGINPFVNHGKDDNWKEFAKRRFLNYQFQRID